jgi:hypothetical protein
MVDHRHQLLMKKISGFLIILIFIGLILTAGCSQSRQSSGLTIPSLSLKPAPTTDAQFQIHEPATDGNLSVTVLNTTGVRSGAGQKKYYVQVRLVNLRSDHTIEVYPEDFQLTGPDGSMYITTVFYSVPSHGYTLSPHQGGSPELEFNVPCDAVGYTLKFDFSRASGIPEGEKIVYFNL